MAEREDFVDLKYLKIGRNRSIGLATGLVPVSVFFATNPQLSKFVYVPSVLSIVFGMVALNLDSKIERVIKENEAPNK